MVFLFRDKSVVNIFFLILLSVGIHMHFFMAAPLLIAGQNDGLLSVLLLQYLQGLNPAVLFVSYQAIVLLQAIRLNMVLTDFRMFQTTNYTTAMTYILLTGFLSQW